MAASAGREVVAGAGRGDNSQPKTEQNRGKTEERRKTTERWRQQGTGELDGGGAMSGDSTGRQQKLGCRRQVVAARGGKEKEGKGGGVSRVGREAGERIGEFFSFVLLLHLLFDRFAWLSLFLFLILVILNLHTYSP